VASVAWPPKINQIVVGFSDGRIKILYSEQLSSRGILLPLRRTKTSGGMFVGEATELPIFNPHSLPLFRNKDIVVTGSSARYRTPSRPSQPKALPEPPAEGPGRGGKLGTTVTQSIMKNIIKDTSRDEDPREALLKYAEISEKDPKFITPLYQDTQPKPILDEELLQREAEAEKRRLAEEERVEKFVKRRKQH
jgi:hypothetical protein